METVLHGSEVRRALRGSRNLISWCLCPGGRPQDRAVESQQSPSQIIVDDSEEREEELSFLQVLPVVIQKTKSQQPVVPRGNLAGSTQMVEHTSTVYIHRPKYLIW